MIYELVHVAESQRMLEEAIPIQVSILKKMLPEKHIEDCTDNGVTVFPSITTGDRLYYNT